MAYLELYCDFANGSNVNAGDNKTLAATTNGAYTRAGGAGGTDRFVAASGTPFAASVAGDIAAFRADGATVAAFLARITTVNSSTSIDVSLTAVSGTRPATVASGESCVVGGVWKGPNAAENFPIGTVTTSLTSAAAAPPRINLKNSATYNVTAVVINANPGPLTIQGYSATPGDGGRAIIDGGGTTASHIFRTTSAADGVTVADIQVQNNTGFNAGFSFASSNLVIRCIATNIGGNGFTATSGASAAYQQFVECEAYLCDQTDNAISAGFLSSVLSQAHFYRCLSHHHGITNQGCGFFSTAPVVYWFNCVAANCGGTGFVNTSGPPGVVVMRQCDSYSNGGHGLELDQMNAFVENSNFVKNTLYGITSSTNEVYQGWIANCGFGSGSKANGSGATNNLDSVQVVNPVTYASGVTPWVDPDNGDFRISLGAAKNAGRGSFTETKSGFAGTVGYPDIGAALHLDAGGPATGVFCFAVHP